MNTQTACGTPVLPDDVFIARHPIFDRQRELIGYELLFRTSSDNRSGVDGDGDRVGDQATARIINHCVNLMGLSSLTGGKRALINVTRRLLLDEVYTVLPREQVVIELLETVEPDPDVIAACRKLKNAGYQLALDDFVFDPRFKPLLELTDILKIDFLLTSPAQRRMLAERYSSSIKLLAEKVETHEDVQEALRLGYVYFQGFFYCKPQIFRTRQVPASQMKCMRFMQEVTREDVSFAKLEALVKQDVALSVKLLRYLNSAAFSLRNEVTSIRHALALLGLQQLRKWAALVATTCMADTGDTALTGVSLVRARFCENLAAIVRDGPSGMDLFLTGLLSTLDAMLHVPMDELLKDLSISDAVKAALLGGRNRARDVFDLAMACERAEWNRVGGMCDMLGITSTQAARAYQDAVHWASRVATL